MTSSTLKIYFNRFFIFLSNKPAIGEEVKLRQFSSAYNSFDDAMLYVESAQGSAFFLVKETDDAFTFVQSHFQMIEAAGGLVKNSLNEYLLIYRNDKWDLPKGKLEKAEKTDVAAVREVEEECGIDNIQIENLLSITFHSYFAHDQRWLKRTHWYNMNTTATSPLQPQLEENITDAQWMKPSDIRQKTLGNIYPLIEDVLSAAIQW